MNNKKFNPVLKQIISEITSNAKTGRLNLDWRLLNEAEKPADDPLAVDAAAAPEAAPQAGAAPAAGAQAGAAPAAAPQAGAAPAAGAQAGAAPAAAPAAAGTGDADAEEIKKAAEEKGAEVEKAKEELEKKSYVKLNSNAGVKYLLDKVLGDAFKRNTTDALAHDMADKLKIVTKSDVEVFEKDMTNGKWNMVNGMSDLINTLKEKAAKDPEKSEESETPEEPKN
jgi:hypothetical protein